MWASGSNGTVLLSNDGGASWRVRVIKDAEELDIRDIHGFDDGTAIATTAGTPARIYRTTNGGITWKSCGEKTGAFFDSISFWNDSNGILMSDPIDGRLFLVGTNNGGKTWRPLPPKRMPQLEPGEAGFAASGTNICCLGEKGLAVALANGATDRGTLNSRILYSPDRCNTWSSWATPIRTNKTSGIFSTCFINRNIGCIVGGNFKEPDDTSYNYAVTKDGGETWATPSPRVPPSGYRSCVAKLNHGKEA